MTRPTKRKIGEGDLLGEDFVVTGVMTGERGGTIGPHGQRPHLKLFGGNARIEGLDERDFVKQPVSAPMIGNVFCAVGDEHLRLRP